MLIGIYKHIDAPNTQLHAHTENDKIMMPYILKVID